MRTVNDRSFVVLLACLAQLAAGAFTPGPAHAQTPVLQPRIANGVESSAWPEVATLLTNTGLCTATFVGCRSVVTAAHCVCDASGTGAACGGGDFVLDPAQAVVFAPQAGFFAIGQIRIPPNFSFGVAGDVAVLELDHEVRGVRPRAINEIGRPAFGIPATIVGFGRSQEGGADAGVERVGAVVTASCAAAGVPDATHLCWDFLFPLGAPGTDSNTCPGDSGGPLLVDLGAGLELAGIHSGGDGPCSGSGSSFDTDVFVQRNWLRDQVGVDLDRATCGDGAAIGDAAVTSLSFTGTDVSQWLEGFQVAPATKVLRVGLNGTAVGDVDLYVKAGSAPTTTDFDCTSAANQSFEYCEIEDPTPGTWYALVNLAAGNGTRFQLDVTMLPESPGPPPLALGQMLISNFASYELTHVESASGDRAVASSPLRGSGPDLAGPEGLALDRDRTLLVANPFERNLLRVVPQSGNRILVSGCADAACSSTAGAGPAFLAPRFVALEPDRRILVADRSTPGSYALIRVDPMSGDRSVVSGCADPACAQVVGAGPPIGRLFGIALDAAGTIYAADGQALYRIDPVSGDRVLVSGCTDAACSGQVGSGPDFGQPADLVIAPSGAVYASYQIEGVVFGALRQIDPSTGARTLVSGCEDIACSTVRGTGPRFDNPFGLGLDLDGTLLVADSQLDAVLRVDPVSGDRTLVSGCADASCSSARGAGPGFGEALDLVVIPEPDAARLAIGVVAALCAFAGYRTRPDCDPDHTPHPRITLDSPSTPLRRR